MRTQEQYLEKLKSMRHNIYLDGECIGRDDPHNGRNAPHNG